MGTTRQRLPQTRNGLTTELLIESDGSSYSGYITANTDEEGRLREVFLHGFGKEGSTLNGWAQVAAVLLSIGLQHEMPLSMIAHKIAGMRFEPYGTTNIPEIPTCRSMPDLVVRWLALHYGDASLCSDLKIEVTA